MPPCDRWPRLRSVPAHGGIDRRNSRGARNRAQCGRIQLSGGGEMKTAHRTGPGILAVTLLAAGFLTPAKGAPAQMVVTAMGQPQSLEAGDVSVVEGKTPLKVVGLDRLNCDLGDMQLF